MRTDPVDIHNLLSPHLSRIELLSRLSPVLGSEQETVETLVLVLEMVGDYARALRQALDNLAEGRG
jgi:hypothetical protein